MILITGGAGFIGSHVVAHFRQFFPQTPLMILDALTYASNYSTLKPYIGLNCYFIQGSIGDDDLVRGLFERHDIRHVIHLAAESHVDNSIHSPGIFVDTNVRGTFVLLEAARAHWMQAPHQVKDGYAESRFHHVSTDEVYGSLGDTGYFTEASPYQPNSPYSATKAASDFLVRAAFHTYGLNVVTTNCSNNYGPHQHAEKLIPTIIRSAKQWQRIPIYGSGKQTRDWLYVSDHAGAIERVFHHGRSGATYLIGGRNERSNLELAHLICSILDSKYPSPNGSYSTLIEMVSDRPGHDWRYAINPELIERELGWVAPTDFEGGLCETIDWLWAQ